jgi:hypothetical protein
LLQNRRESLVEVRRAARRTIWHQCKAGDVADAAPAEAGVQTSGIAVRDGIEDEQRPASGERESLGLRHESGTEAAPAGSSVDEHLAEVRAVRLILRKAEHELDRAADARVILGNQDRTLAGGYVGRNSRPETLCASASEGEHEPDGRTGLDAIDEHLREPFHVRVFQSLQLSNAIRILMHQFSLHRIDERRIATKGFV